MGACLSSKAKDVEGAQKKLSSSRRAAEDETKNITALKAAMLIQTWYRRYLAVLEARRRCTWVIYQSIEYSSEHDQTKLYSFFTDVISLASNEEHARSVFENALTSKKLISTKAQQSLEEEEAELLRLTSFNRISVESHYDGPRVSFPLDLSQLRHMIEAFKAGRQIHARYLLELVHNARSVIKQRKTVQEVSTSISRQFTVVGDLHGQLPDLLKIFWKNGLPDVTNPYIFNGDFVDRGTQSIEVMCLLCAAVVLYPNAVFLNRGNHEDYLVNCTYGFTREIHDKYKTHSMKVSRIFADFFSWLPVATVIDEAIVVVHGGISNKTDLTKLSKVDRHKFITACDRKKVEKSDVVEWEQISDILWSDPGDNKSKGVHRNNDRGVAWVFGHNVTDEFLARHKLQMMIRSHQCKDKGYEYKHNGKVLTVFSASNYYALNSNLGAYVKLDSRLNVRVHQFSSTAEEASSLTMAQSLSKMEDSAINQLRAKICAYKAELVELFKLVDTNDTGMISVKDWCACMDKATSLTLPWMTIRHHLAKKIGEKIQYMSTFDSVAVTNKYSNQAGSVTEELYKHRDSLETIFRIIDKDNSGKISMEEFKEAYKILSQHTGKPLSESVMEEIAHLIDINKDGFIDFNEFLEAFRIVDFQSNTQLQKK